MITFMDLEINKKNEIFDIGLITDKDEKLHTKKLSDAEYFIKRSDFFVGHNFVNHDLKYLKETNYHKYFKDSMIIDTLFLSTLLFPKNPYHKLVKDDKLETDDLNNPLSDAINTYKLFLNIVDQFKDLKNNMKIIYYNLLNDQKGFEGFFDAIKYKQKERNLESLIKEELKGLICNSKDLSKLIKYNPIELSYVLALLSTDNNESILPKWAITHFSKIQEIIYELRNSNCQKCDYCKKQLNPLVALNKYFSYDGFRTFDVDGETKHLQQEAVESALNDESIIVVFPTGGGKSLTFQLPALMHRENTRGLTVVISPLQSLMKDQVDNLENKNITSAVTINGSLDPLERAEAIDRIKNGTASILYIAPESLRSKTIENLLLSRQVVRFVIDEAHCFSTWGHDFRVDYLYIGEFIKSIQFKKGIHKPIPVSCFSATAKQNVIEDISDYFKSKLDIDMKLITTSSPRKNLSYKVYPMENEEKKYQQLRNLIDQENCPTIIYASRRNTVQKLYDRLNKDGLEVAYFHGGLEKEIKIEQQNLFMTDKKRIMVATSAFGMGVDKSDIKCVIHYEISNSIENYVQEAGRAGRNDKISANCYILFNEDDLNKHFDILNKSKLNLKEIQSVWKAIKELTKYRETTSVSALELAKKAGWDEKVYDLPTRTSTAISVLEEDGFIKRGQNSPRLFADSILAKSVIDAFKIIEESKTFDEYEIKDAKNITSKLIKAKRRSDAGNEDGESKIDYIADELGISREQTIKVVNKLRDIKVLADDKDLNVTLKDNFRIQTAQHALLEAIQSLRFIVGLLSEQPNIFDMRYFNEELSKQGLDSSIKLIRSLINYLSINNHIKLTPESKDLVKISLVNSQEVLLKHIQKLSLVSSNIIEYIGELHKKSSDPKKILSFSIIELKENYNKQVGLLDEPTDIKEVETSLTFLRRMSLLQIEGGFMVLYSPYNIERIVKDVNKKYNKTDFKKLETFYKNKIKQIHIVGEYAKKMIENSMSAQDFVNDYFTLQYDKFLNKHFSGSKKEEIERNLTPTKYKKLFGDLTKQQEDIILDKEHRRIAVAAGPGSGKTKLLVHKLASILYTEDVKPEQLLMLTFSRAAVIEFRERLKTLINQTANFIDITTFHSYAFDLLGKVGDLTKTDTVIKDATALINDDKIDEFKITKSIIVLDEAQDMNEEEFRLIEALINYNDNIRIIAVGDDDQNIFEFRGSNSKYFRDIANEEEAFYQLSTNFRSDKNLVEFTNQVANKITERVKNLPIVAYSNKLGDIRIIKQKNNNFIHAIVDDVIRDDFNGNTCVITRTNEEALQITGLLNKRNLKAKFIQSNDNFKLLDLIELNSFVQKIKEKTSGSISTEQFKQAYDYVLDNFEKSKNLELAIKVINKFDFKGKKIVYVSDIMEYLVESNISDFDEKEKIVVSTYHKAKGKEFDNVYILFDANYKLSNPDLRTLYVGLTRAKHNLVIHTNHYVFDNINVDNIVRLNDETPYEIPKLIAFQLSHKDIHLGYFAYVQHRIKNLFAGDELTVDSLGIYYKGEKVLNFAAKFKDRIENILSQGYKVESAIVKYILKWFNQNDNNEYIIMLPEITFTYIGKKVEENIGSIEIKM